MKCPSCNLQLKYTKELSYDEECRFDCWNKECNSYTSAILIADKIMQWDLVKGEFAIESDINRTLLIKISNGSKFTILLRLNEFIDLPQSNNELSELIDKLLKLSVYS